MAQPVDDESGDQADENGEQADEECGDQAAHQPMPPWRSQSEIEMAPPPKHWDTRLPVPPPPPKWLVQGLPSPPPPPKRNHEQDDAPQIPKNLMKAKAEMVHAKRISDKNQEDGKRRTRPRGGKNNANKFWHTAYAAAKAQGPKTEWIFRTHCPKPGEEDLWKEWMTWAEEELVSPTSEDLSNDAWQLLLPSHWRSRKYKGITSMREFRKARDGY
jgi:hypothetical protein